MKAFLGGIAGAMLFASASQAAIVTNGSFETGDFSGWSVSGGGTTPGGGPRVITTGGSNSTGYGDNVPNYDGTHAAFFVDDNAIESISQAVTLSGATRYNLSFALFATASGAANPGFFSLTDTIGTFSQTFLNTDVSVGNWTPEGGSFTTTTGGSYLLSFNFAAGGTPSKDVLLDAVSLSVVPLPASAPMFGGALLALVGFGYGMNRWVAPKGTKEAAAA